MSLALYRKYRPQLLADVLGQERIAQTISQALKNDKVGHAYIFSGPRGTGKTSVARILARAVNCEKNTTQGLKQGEPCNICAPCQRAINGQELDLIEIDAASNRGIDEIRELREKVRFAPGKNTKKVFLIDEFHMLTKEAFNALLKTLEEPPAHAIFILATTEIHNVPATILSRAQHYVFKALGQKDLETLVVDVAKKEKLTIAKDAVALLAAQAQGGARDVLGMLDLVQSAAAGKQITVEIVTDNLALPNVEQLARWTQAFVERDQLAALKLIQNQTQQGIDFVNFGKNLVQYLRAILLYQVDEKLGLANGAMFTKDQTVQIIKIADSASKRDILNAIALINQATNEVRLSQVDYLPFEIATLRLIQVPTTTTSNPINTYREAEKKTKENKPKGPQTSGQEVKNSTQALHESAPPKIIKSDSLDSIDPKIEEKIVATWHQTVAQVRDKNIGLGSLLNNVVLLQAKAGQALLVVDYEFYQERIMTRENRHLIESKLEEILKQKVSVDCRVADTLSAELKTIYLEKKKTRQVKAQSSKDAVKSDEPLAQLAVDLLGGQVVE